MDSPRTGLEHIVRASGEDASFRVGDYLRVGIRMPIGHYRVPIHIRGKIGNVELIISPRAVDNEDEGYGRNAGSRHHYYRVSFLMSEIWPAYLGNAKDCLRYEICETWLQKE